MKSNNIIKIGLIVLPFCIISTLAAQSFEIPADNFFYDPHIKSYSISIPQPDDEVSDQTDLIQESIDLVSANGGGVVTIEAVEGKQIYNIVKGVHIKSNVHIRVSPNVIFKSNSPDKVTLFSAGKKGTKRVENFSISCTDPNSFFLFDFTDRTPGKRNGGSVAVSVGGVDNFRLSDIRVKDNMTPYSCITVNLLEYKDNEGTTRYMFARNGIIENILAHNTHYGYGVVQCQAAYNVLYRDLIGEGGATLRLETGAIGKANLADRGIFIDMVYGTKISCENGQAALTLSPHTVNNGKVFIDDLTAISCEAGAIVAAGFLSGKKGQRDKDGNAIDGYTYGYFDNNSIVSDLKVIYGTSAQLRPQRRTFVPCSQKHLIASEKNADEESYMGPTVAGIIYFAKRGTDRESGYYTVHTPGFVMKDFPVTKGVRENKEYVVSPGIDGFVDCE